MKIKEVCERTGLTRRAVRFYEEKGLVSPDIDAGNEYRDYSEADVRRLRLVARLRELARERVADLVHDLERGGHVNLTEVVLAEDRLRILEQNGKLLEQTHHTGFVHAVPSTSAGACTRAC